MTVEVEITPVSSDTCLFQCSVLRVGNFKILLDCGWVESLDVDLLAAVPPDVDAVLLSHYDLAHCGALPYLMKKQFRTKPPKVFATEPVRRLGELTLASLHEDVDKAKDFSATDETVLTLEEIVACFNGVVPLQFNEPVKLTADISITAQPAGRLIGGAYWVITVGSQRIVYCVDYSLSSDRHVPGLSVLPAKRANVLITASPLAQIRSTTADQLIAAMKSTLRCDGSVLLPVDPNGRVLELLLLLENAWSADVSLTMYPVIFLSPLGDVVLDQIKTRMEWMNESVLTDFEASANFTAHPFLFSHITILSSLAEFSEKVPHRKPKVVLSTCASLEFGDSREIFARYAPDPANLVLLTQFSGLEASCLANRVCGSSNPSSLMEKQFIKSSFPDEQLREIYREKLQQEAQEDELRRRRAREKQQRGMTAPSSASAIPVDLIRMGNSYESFDLDGCSNFFRPSLFAAQTVASGAVLKNPAQLSDYGEVLQTVEMDTWRANADMGGHAIEGMEEAVKGERVKSAKDEIKGDLDERGVKAEMGNLPSGIEFDWRRDLTVRFGEPRRVELRDRPLKVACQIKQFFGFEGAASSVHRREFISAAKPSNLVLLPTRNLHDLQAVAMLVSGSFFPCQEDVLPSLTEEPGPPIPCSVGLSILAEKKWLTLDPSLALDFVQLRNSKIRIAKLNRAAAVGPLSPQETPDLIQVPNGEYVEYVLAEGGGKKRTHRGDGGSNSGSLLVSCEHFRLGKFAKVLRDAMPAEKSVEFVSTEKHARALLVNGDTVIMTTPGDCPLIEIVGTPSETFYQVRDALYANTSSV